MTHRSEAGWGGRRGHPGGPSQGSLPLLAAVPSRVGVGRDDALFLLNVFLASFIEA